jgi:hypothetical protein
MRIARIATPALVALTLPVSAPAEERTRPPVPAWVHDYTARDTFGADLFAVREVSAECKTRLGTHLTSRRLFTVWYARSRRSLCR